MGKNVTTYLVHDSGRMTCQRHAGSTLAGAIAAKPLSMTYKTDMGTWDRLTEQEYAYLADAGVTCDRCWTERNQLRQEVTAKFGGKK